MAKIAQMPAADIVNSMHGVLDYYTWCNLNIVRKWPRAPERARNPYVMYQADQFTYIGQLAGTLPENVVDTYKWLADKTGLSWKDWLTRNYINGKTHLRLIGTAEPPPPPPMSLDDLEDVSVPSPADGEKLTWEAATSLWKAK